MLQPQYTDNLQKICEEITCLHEESMEDPYCIFEVKVSGITLFPHTLL